MKKLALKLVVIVAFSTSIISCKKESTTPNNGNGSNTGNTTNTSAHPIDAKLVGKWMWTRSGDAAYYNDNGVYSGSAYGFAIQYVIGSDGYGTCFNHIYSTIGVGSALVVDISYKGFFESNSEGRMGFFPTSGTYKSSSGEDRALRADELWNEQTGIGRNFIYQYQVTTQDGRECFKVTASNGIVDAFFKLP